MAHKKGLTSISLTQVVAFVGLILASYFVVGFGKVALIGHQLRDTKAQLQSGVEALSADVSDLEVQRDYVESEAYVERAAREEFKMSQPGDQVVVPLYEAGKEQATRPTSAAAVQSPPAPWQEWWALFFDQ